MSDDMQDDNLATFVASLDLPAMDRDLDIAMAVKSCKRPKRIRVNAVLRELNALRDEEAELQLKLLATQGFFNTRLCRVAKEKSKWGRLAIQQNTMKVKALRENRELHRLVAEQNAFCLHMQSTILKRTQSALERLESEKWQALTLGTKNDTRIAAIHAIANRQFDLMESQMIAHGLVDPKEDVFVIKSLSDATQLCSLGLRYTCFDVSVDKVMRAVMEVMKERDALIARTKSTALPRVHSRNTVFPIDTNTIYIQELLVHPQNNVQVVSNMVIKKFIHDNNITIVWRSILNDENEPECPKGFVNDECGWVNLEQCGSKTIYRAYLKASSPTPPIDAVSELNDLMHLLQLETNTIEQQTQVSMDTFVSTVQDAFTRMFQRFEDAIKSKIRQLDA